jgi:rod shape-determining protein MreC
VAKRGPGPEIRTAQPLRTLAQRLLFLAVLASAIGLMIVGRTDPDVFERARTTVTDAAAPILDTVARPVAAIDRAVHGVKELVYLRDENVRLRLEVERLKQWQATARWLEIENARMRDLLAFERTDVERFVTGRVIGAGGTFVRALLVNVGTEDGAAKGQPAVTGDGLIGRVAEAGLRSSRILLITDLNSRIPVQIENSSARAILAGDNTPFPRLILGAPSADLKPGNRVMTSGDGGAFPPGLPVGTILSVDDSGVRVQPHAAYERPELVRLMDFGLSGILAPTER